VDGGHPSSSQPGSRRVVEATWGSGGRDDALRVEPSREDFLASGESSEVGAARRRKNLVKQAVCVLIQNEVGEVLSVSRRGKPDDLGLPGGKVDPGETLEEACIRETFEETGIKISNLRLVFQKVCPGEVDYDSFTFTADYEGEPLGQEPGIDVKWAPWRTLLDEANTFSDYNRDLFDAWVDYQVPEEAQDPPADSDPLITAMRALQEEIDDICDKAKASLDEGRFKEAEAILDAIDPNVIGWIDSDRIRSLYSKISRLSPKVDPNTVRWFGPEWEAAICTLSPREETPVGQTCLLSGRPVMRLDRGILVRHHDQHGNSVLRPILRETISGEVIRETFSGEKNPK